ncbi:hypothetical protein V1281_000297 [Nitrobacteraceae bacterium AZCC 2161]
MEHTTIRLIDRIEDVIAEVIYSRASSTALLFLTGGLLIDLNAKKLTILCVIVFMVHKLAFGQRRLEQLGFVFLAVSIVIWLGVIPSLQAIAQLKAEGMDAAQSVHLR